MIYLSLSSLSHTHSNSYDDPFRVHLRSMRSGAAHPSALEPAHFSHRLERADFTFSPRIRICGPLVGVFFTSYGDNVMELVIWNWKKGTREFVSRLTETFAPSLLPSYFSLLQRILYSLSRS